MDTIDSPSRNGVLVIDKPRGLTSHDVVAKVRRFMRTKRVGHLGTLDPLATGVLPLVVGRATRLASLLSAGDKVYSAVIRLGLATDTYDVTGTAIASDDFVAPHEIDRRTVDDVIGRFVGRIHQRPPAYSAKKINGVRAYTLARQQRAAPLKTVEVTVRSIEVHALDDNRLSCRLTCGPGFYVRSLAHDLGIALRCGGCLETLRRDRSGDFSLNEATALPDIEEDPLAAAGQVVPLAKLLPRLPRVVVTEGGLARVRHGNALRAPDLLDPPPPSPVQDVHDSSTDVRIIAPDGELVAIGRWTLARKPTALASSSAGRSDGSSTASVLQPRIVLV